MNIESFEDWGFKKKKIKDFMQKKNQKLPAGNRIKEAKITKEKKRRVRTRWSNKQDIINRESWLK